MTLTFRPDLVQDQGEPGCQISMSNERDFIWKLLSARKHTHLPKVVGKN